MQELKLNIEGMTCGSCSRTLTARISKFDFTTEVDIDHETGVGKIVVDKPERKEEIVKAIETLGYKVV